MNKPVLPSKALKTPVSLEPPASTETYLAQEDLHRLLYLGGRVDSYSQRMGMKQQEGLIDEANLRVKSEQLQVEQLQFAVRQRARMDELAAISRQQSAELTEYEAFKASLAAKYQVDFSKVALDDVTGKVVALPDSP